jgi:crotonobetaine/carnitine-CoA ligase
LAHFDDQGRVYVHGRLKHMIRRRGENISAWELENVVRRHPEIADCVVVGVPSPLGEEDVKLVVVLRPGASLSPAGLYSWCQSNMARFMTPRFVEFRTVLPRTEIGKVAVEQLRLTDTGVWDAESSRRRLALAALSGK